MDKRIVDYFDANSGDFLADLSAFVRIESFRGEAAPSEPYGPGPKSALVAAWGMAEHYGFESRLCGDRVTVVEHGPGKPALGMLAHLDVVPPAGIWRKTQPFNMLNEDGVLYGRGVADDKGPAMAAFYAMRCVKDLGIPLKRRVRLILGSDEECGSDDLAWYTKQEQMPPMVFTPDANFPLVNSEKGKLDMTITTDPLPRDDGRRVISVKGGSVPNAVPSDCVARVDGYTEEELRDAFARVDTGCEFTFEERSDGSVRVCAYGRASHASRPDGGVNAVTAMISCLVSMDFPDSPTMRALRAVNAILPHGDFGGHAVGAYCEDAHTGGLTVNLGVFSCGRAGVRAQVDCRVPACGDGAAIADRFQAALGDCGKVKVTGLLPAHYTPEDSPFVRGLLSIYEDYTGLPGEPLSIGGLTYVHEVEGGVAFGCSFPGGEYHMHEPDERMPVKELLLAGEMFAQAIVDFCGA